MDALSFDASVLAPAAFPAVGALVLLSLQALRRPRASAPRSATTTAALAVVFLSLSLYTALLAVGTGVEGVFDAQSPRFRLDPLSSLAIALVCGAALLSVLLSAVVQPGRRVSPDESAEYHALLLLSVSGACLLVCAVDWLLVVVALELMLLPAAALAGFERERLRSNEAALEMFAVNALASALLLYGLALLYGATGSTDFEGVREGFAGGGALSWAGLGLVVAGAGCKLAAVPFHPWAPDAYEGAPSPVAVHLASGVQLALFVWWIRVVALALPPELARLELLFAAAAALTLIVGHTMAAMQQRLVRLFAFASVGHVGLLLLGFAAASEDAWAAILFSLVAWGLSFTGAVAVVVALARAGRTRGRIEDLTGLGAQRPGLAFLLLLFTFSMAGLPGTAGFMGRVHLLSAAIDAGWVVVPLVAVSMSVVGFAYTLRIAVAMYMREPQERHAAHGSLGELLVLALCAAGVLALGLLPNDAGFFGAPGALDLARAAVQGLAG